MLKKPNLAPIIAFWILGFVWGTNFIISKQANAFISPVQIVFLRVLCGFIPVITFAFITKSLHWQQIKHWPHFLVMSLLATVIYYYGFAKGISYLYSGIAGAVSGAIPLFSFLLATIFLKEEKISAKKIIGVIIGLGGVLLIAKPINVHVNEQTLIGVSYMVAGSMSVGASFVYAKKFVTPLQIPAAALTTYQLGLGCLILSFITNFDNITNINQSPIIGLLLILGMGFLGTGLAYVLYYYIIQKLGAITASSATYIPPIIALLIGALIFNEPITVTDYIATVMIFAGVILLRQH